MHFLLPIYIVTAVISIAVALLLMHLTRLTSQARVKAEKQKRRREYQSSDIVADEGLKQTVYEEISEVIDSRQRCQSVSEAVSDIFTQELKKRVELNNRELSKKYDTIVEQKGQSEEIAWNKYKKVLGAKRETEAVIRSIAEGLVVIDAKGKVIMMNPAAENLLDVSRKNKIGRPILENLKKEQLVSLSKDSPDREGREIEVISKEGETKKILRSSSAVIENENGQTVGMVSVLSDVTKQRELDQIKSDFVSKVSHELRTPIVTVQNSLSLLLDKTAGPLNESQEKFLTIAQRNLKRLGFLVDDILDLSKFEASKTQMRFEDCSIEKIVTEVCDNLVAWARTKSITIEKKVQKDIPEIRMDSNRIIQVLNNLIGNAVKFTPRGGRVAVEAGLDEDRKNLCIIVIDTGVGMAKEDLDKVFDKFQQAGERMATDISGTGLGLTIAREIITLHGGQIWAESEKGQGAKFTFTLPVEYGKK